MSSNFTCCGCWPAFIHGFQDGGKSGRTYRRAKYNEREYSIEFENLVEEEDFYAPAQHIVTDIERDLLARGRFDELLQHENDISHQKDLKNMQEEENARLEDEAYIQAQKEASRVAKQSLKKQMNIKNPSKRTFDSDELSKWLTDEKIDMTSPELDVEDFESFLVKVRAKSAQALEESGRRKDVAIFEQTLSQGLAATKIAGDALNALQPVELHAVDTSFDVSFNSNAPSHGSQFSGVSAEILSKHPIAHVSQAPSSYASQVIDALPVSQKSQFKLVDIYPEAPQSSLETVDISVSYPSQPQFPETQEVQIQMQIPPSSMTNSLNDPHTNIEQSPTRTSPISITNVSQSQVISNSSPMLISPLNTPTTNVSQSQMIDQSSSKLISPLSDTSQHISPDSQPPISYQSEFRMTYGSQLPVYNETFAPISNPVSSNNSNLPQPAVNHSISTSQSVEVPSDVLNLHSENGPSLPSASQLIETDIITTIATINTPRNVATNLKPVENNIETVLPILSNGVEVQSFKMALGKKEKNNDIMDDSLEFDDFDNDFVSAYSNSAFEDILA